MPYPHTFALSLLLYSTPHSMKPLVYSKMQSILSKERLNMFVWIFSKIEQIYFYL